MTTIAKNHSNHTPHLQPTRQPAIWLVPFAQWKAVAKGFVKAHTELPSAQPHGVGLWEVAPQILTLKDWANHTGLVPLDPTDLQFDAAMDSLTAADMLVQSGLPDGALWIERLLSAVYELAPVAAAIPPLRRMEWHAQHLTLFSAASSSMGYVVEQHIGRVALLWAAQSQYETDVLWNQEASFFDAIEHIYITHGLRKDALCAALLANWQHKTTVMSLDLINTVQNLAADPVSSEASASYEKTPIEIECLDQESLVQTTAQCILDAKGHVALIALDRQITRRLCAVLTTRGVSLRDETGWTLSTTHSAAWLMSWLSALSNSASSDEVLGALKIVVTKTSSLAVAQFQLDDLEKTVRSSGWVQWSQAEAAFERGDKHILMHSVVLQWFWDQQSMFKGARTLGGWLQLLKELLQQTGAWLTLQNDAAGQAVLNALHLDKPLDFSHISRRWILQEFLHWMRSVLQSERFYPPTDDPLPNEPMDRHVTVLPLLQSWGRRFDVVIVPGCDTQRLPTHVPLKGDWTANQRQALGLLSKEDAKAMQLQAWNDLIQQKNLHLLWHRYEQDQEQQKSWLLQAALGDGQMHGREEGVEKVTKHVVDVKKQEVSQHSDVTPEAPSTKQFWKERSDGVALGQLLPLPMRLSASAYSDLRACPYRYFARHVLGLSTWEELDEEVDARDVGNWMHGTLKRFHDALQAAPAHLTYSISHTSQLLDACAKAEQHALGLEDVAFLPHTLLWPFTRDAYLSWWYEWQAKGATYLAGEQWLERHIAINQAAQDDHVQGSQTAQWLTLVGKIDRMDALGTSHLIEDGLASNGESVGALQVLDYKTESLEKTRSRIQNADEDTQLAFYALLEPRSVRAAYLNVVDRATKDKRTTWRELPQLQERRDALQRAIVQDVTRMVQGAALKALGDGQACVHCNMRGVCRKDFQ